MSAIKDPGHVPEPSGLALPTPSPSNASSASPASRSSMPTAAPSLRAAPRDWNTDKLALRLGSDLVSAACAGALVAPLISVIDRAIMENASGRDTLTQSLKSSLRALLLRPHTIVFSKPAALICMLYGGTYLTANALDTATSTVQAKPASSVTAGTAKFAASSAANVGLCMYKDQVFVRMFGPPGAVPRPVAPVSYALFTIRDCLTIFASFNVPPLLGPRINERLSEGMKRHVAGATCAQFLAPAAVQFISTPLHLLGLDMYNRPSGVGVPMTVGAGGNGNAGAVLVSWRDRWDLVRKAWLPSAMARICRIVPAFGVGGVVNTKVRHSLIEKLS